MSSTERIRIIVCDDHPVVRKGLVEILRADPRIDVVAEAKDGLEAISLYQQHRPDVLMLDLRMPEMNGVEAIHAIRAFDAAARVIIMTAVDGEEDIYRGLRSGAKGYLLKDAPDEEVIEAILVIMEGRRYLARGAAAKLADRLDANHLSARELEILRLMATGLSNKGVARRTGITEGTVKFHVNNILAKLQCASRTEAVANALKRGLIELA